MPTERAPTMSKGLRADQPQLSHTFYVDNLPDVHRKVMMHPGAGLKHLTSSTITICSNVEAIGPRSGLDTTGFRTMLSMPFEKITACMFEA